MKKKIDVTALGEILIDFTFAGKSSAGKNIFEENPGGAPANCACAVSKLGVKSATEEAVRIVKQAGGFVSYDPNYRETLWGNREDATPNCTENGIVPAKKVSVVDTTGAGDSGIVRHKKGRDSCIANSFRGGTLSTH